MIEYHTQLFILGIFNVRQSEDEQEYRGDDLIKWNSYLSQWIEASDDNVQRTNDEDTSERKVVDDECGNVIFLAIKPAITEKIEAH